MIINDGIFVDVEHQVGSVGSVGPNIAQSHIVSYNRIHVKVHVHVHVKRSLPRTYWYIRHIRYIKLSL